MSSNVLPFTGRPARSPAGQPVNGLPEPAVYTVSEVARLLSLSLGGTYALVRTGDIPAIKLGGRWVVPRRRFHAWLDALAVDQADEPNRRAGGR